MYNSENKTKPSVIISFTGLAILLLLALIILTLWGCPKYNVYEQTMTGKAELQRAIQNRQIAVQEAQAKAESAKSLADAEVTRAYGVAKANQIIGKSLEGNEVYLHYLWLQGLETTKDQIIYVPTEANLPILETNRLQKQP